MDCKMKGESVNFDELFPVPFVSLPLGNFFYIAEENSVYMKIDMEEVNCINIDGFTPEFLPDNTQVLSLQTIYCDFSDDRVSLGSYTSLNRK